MPQSRLRRSFAATALAVLLVAPLTALGTADSAQAAPAKVSAKRLLHGLTVRAESHAGSFDRDRFEHWVDADGDGERTDDEVLKAESSKGVTKNAAGRVVRGAWRSPYDGKRFTSSTRVAVDHLVPLKEAWTSGAWRWSAQRREAFANDLGYAASLVVVSRYADRAKGDREPGAWLPSQQAYRCTYVRNLVAVKSRWKLTVDRSELRALARLLNSECSSVKVTKPAEPVVSKLITSPAATESNDDRAPLPSPVPTRIVPPQPTFTAPPPTSPPAAVVPTAMPTATPL